MITLPQEYVTSIFLQYAGNPEKISSGFRASCPSCMEGKSWGIKKRLYYFPKDGYLHCHNGCGSFGAYYWVKTITGKSFLEIKNEVENGYGDFEYDRILLNSPEEEHFSTPELPSDSINLLDKTQVNYYKNNYWVKRAISFLIKRKLLNAPYKPKSFYISLTDSIHKNRLLIPYYGFISGIDFYQSRALTENQEKNRGKYLSKLNSKKVIFNLNRVDAGSDYLFLMEGPIDSMFLKNSIAIGGIQLTDNQLMDIQYKFPLHKKIWVLDNHKLDSAAANKIKDMLDSDDLFFSWGDKFEKYKDINEFCIGENVKEVQPEDIIKYSMPPHKALFN